MVPVKVGGAIIVTALAATGCGAAATGLLHTASSTVRQASTVQPGSHGQPSTASPAASAAVPSATPRPATTPRPAPPPPQYIAAASPDQSQPRLWIIDTNGHVVASTLMDPVMGWSTAVGPHGAYWIEKGKLHELGVDGSVRIVGTVPSGVDQMVVSPDGSQYAVATSTPIKPRSDVMDNRIYAQRFGAALHVVADRLSDPAHPASDAPQSWYYYLLSWTDRGILFARAPEGGCGCGPFDMEMQAADTALINPVSGQSTTVTRDADCPLSGVGSSGIAACFASKPNSATALALRVMRPGASALNIQMSGTNLAGDAVFSPDASRVAYVTVPAADASCGGSQDTTVRVMTLSSATARAVPVRAFHLAHWMRDGMLVGDSRGSSSTAVETLNTLTGAVTTLWRGPIGVSVLGVIG